MAGTVFEQPGDLLGAVGATFGPTGWRSVEQQQVDQFAAATGDDQWIHVDVERARAGPFGAPIAHGYLTMSLCAPLLAELCSVRTMSMGINYGVDRARFITPVTVPGRVRATGELVSAVEIPGGVQAVVRITIEVEGSEKPAAVVDTVSRYLA